MGSRIITLQRQARELGRLRTGFFNGKAPVRCKTWIVTSHAEHYVQAAAEVWGGQIEKWQPQGNGAPQWRVITTADTLDAIMPPGDPLSQAYESWSRGGVQRRCDGMTESLSDSPCVCRAQWGDQFWENAPRDAACKMTTRLNVILPEMPDIGAWRVETHSFYSANEMAAAVDVLKGSIGEQAMIPVRLRIEQRTRVTGGKTKHFPVVAVELRGSTAGQVLAGAARVVPVGTGSVEPVPTPAAVAAGNRAAIEAAPTVEDFIAAAEGSATLEDLTTNLGAAQRAGFATNMQDQSDPVTRAFTRRRDQLLNPSPAVEQTPTTPAPVSVRESPEADLLWMQIVQLSPWPMSELEKQFAKAMGGVAHSMATESELEMFLRRLRNGDFTKPAPAAAGDEAVPF